jgi:RNA polymerase sigma factor (sigma-70 family)
MLACLLRAHDTNAILARLDGMARAAVGGWRLPGGGDDDLVQEARLAIAHAVDCFRGVPDDFEAFAYVCARHAVISAVRRGAAAKRRASPVGATAAASGTDVVELVLARERLRDTLTALNALSERDRRAIRVGVRGGYRTAARELECSEGAVKLAVYRARRRLRTLTLEV